MTGWNDSATTVRLAVQRLGVRNSRAIVHCAQRPIKVGPILTYSDYLGGQCVTEGRSASE